MLEGIRLAGRGCLAWRCGHLLRLLVSPLLSSHSASLLLVHSRDRGRAGSAPKSSQIFLCASARRKASIQHPASSPLPSSPRNTVHASSLLIPPHSLPHDSISSSNSPGLSRPHPAALSSFASLRWASCTVPALDAPCDCAARTKIPHPATGVCAQALPCRKSPISSNDNHLADRTLAALLTVLYAVVWGRCERAACPSWP